jgi:hypothetical protein
VATFNPTVALALPLEGFATVIQGALLTALQEHPVRVVTTNERDPPPAATAACGGAIE